MDSLSVSPDALRDRGWDVSDAGCGSRFASAGHESDLALHQQGWVGSSAVALAGLRDHWHAANRHLHGRVDALADGLPGWLCGVRWHGESPRRSPASGRLAGVTA